MAFTDQRATRRLLMFKFYKSSKNYLQQLYTDGMAQHIIGSRACNSLAMNNRLFESLSMVTYFSGPLGSSENEAPCRNIAAVRSLR